LNYKSEERRGSGSYGALNRPKPHPDLTRWRSLEEISSKLRKIEWFRGCRQGVNLPLSAGPWARAAPWESRLRERRTTKGQGSSEVELSIGKPYPPTLSLLSWLGPSWGFGANSGGLGRELVYGFE